jgi:hypothetical protein
VCIFEGEMKTQKRLGPLGVQAGGPYMRNRFTSRIEYWKALAACPMVLGWVRKGFMAWFKEEVPYREKPNQQSCFEPQAHKDFIDGSMEALLERGVIGAWDPAWGKPRVISPLKIALLR